MALLYDELPPDALPTAEQHLRECGDCRAAVDRWRGTMRQLDTDQPFPSGTRIPAKRVAHRSPWAWAAAAAAAVTFGWAVGRATGPSRTEIQAMIERSNTRVVGELREQYRADLDRMASGALQTVAAENRQWLADVSVKLTKSWIADRREWLQVLQQIEDCRMEQLATLRLGLLQLAQQTGNGFQQTEDQFNLLASSRLQGESAPSLKPAGDAGK